MKSRLNFPLNLQDVMEHYILLAIDDATKWVEAKVLHTNTKIIITTFLYEYILNKFECLVTIVTN